MASADLTIGVGSDHAAIGLRGALADHLRQRGHTVWTCGPETGARSDYPDQASEVSHGVVSGRCDLGVLVCGTGIGMSIAANKVAGIRAALVHEPVTARLAAQHNRANVLCLGGRLLATEYAIELLDIWLDTAFEARHQARLDKIHALEAGP
ncbi:MAG: ribose 5-phosphate isomerase B [Myxococcota bacterium]|jgi:ribose 5-phosphate isomerase B